MPQNKLPTSQQPLALALKLAVITVIAAALLGGVAHFSEQQRQESKRQYALQQLVAVAPAAFNNDPQTVARKMPSGDTLYPLYQDTRLVGYVVETVTPDGYSGDIRLLIGLDSQGQIHAVYPLAHKETPGLGDRIHPQRSAWINGFKGMSKDSSNAAWKTARQGGHFRSLSGASITANAVLRQVQKALRQEIQQPPYRR